MLPEWARVVLDAMARPRCIARWCETRDSKAGVAGAPEADGWAELPVALWTKIMQRDTMDCVDMVRLTATCSGLANDTQMADSVERKRKQELCSNNFLDRDRARMAMFGAQCLWTYTKYNVRPRRTPAPIDEASALRRLAATPNAPPNAIPIRIDEHGHKYFLLPTSRGNGMPL